MRRRGYYECTATVLPRNTALCLELFYDHSQGALRPSKVVDHLGEAILLNRHPHFCHPTIGKCISKPIAAEFIMDLSGCVIMEDYGCQAKIGHVVLVPVDERFSCPACGAVL